MTTVDLSRNARSHAAQEFSTEWSHPRNSYRVHVAICPDETGGFYAYAVTIPGIASQGETFDEALTNIREAATATIAAYLENKQAIPYVVDDAELPRGCIERWITVNV